MTMQSIRTNQTMHISQLIPELLMHFNVLNGTGTFPPADGTIQSNATSQDEEGGPVRPAERVPYSSSHYLVSQVSAGETMDRERSASSGASACSGTTDPSIEVAAA